MFGVKEINKKEDFERLNKLNNYNNNSSNNYRTNDKMLSKFVNNLTHNNGKCNDNNDNHNNDDDNIKTNYYLNTEDDFKTLNNTCLKPKTILNDKSSAEHPTTMTIMSSSSSSSNSLHIDNNHKNGDDAKYALCNQSKKTIQSEKEQEDYENTKNHQDIENKNYSSDDDDSTNDTDFSTDSSDLSNISDQDWKPMTKLINWVTKQINMGVYPCKILSHILSNGGSTISSNLNDITWRILASMLLEPPRRQKLKHINTLDDVIRLLHTSKNIIVLTGAGVSVSCGIPDFRSNNGIYNRLAKDFPDLPDPQAMFDINYFSKDPRPFYKFAREIYPGQFTPSPCHRFIKLLEKKQKLLRNYTQNIDTLEQIAGIKNVIECHGSFATASCTRCKYKTTADEIRDDIFSQRIPLCPKCQLMNTTIKPLPLSGIVGENNAEIENTNEMSSYSEIVQNGIMKPDIVFFGEELPDAFHSAMAIDKDKCDLLIVIGSSLKVQPVALIPSSIPPDVPQILINREQLNHLEFDVELLGDSDVIINHLCHLLGEGWEEVCWNTNYLTESRHLKPKLETQMMSSSSINDDMKSQTISDISSKSTILTDGSNSPFCDSGFDSSSSHPTYNNVIPSIKDNNQQLQLQEQQQQRYQTTITSENITLFNIDTQKLNETKNHEDNENDLLATKSRHLSVDSSKDSGICDSLNMTLISTTGTNSYNFNNCKNNYDNDNNNGDGHRHNHHNNEPNFVESKSDLDKKDHHHIMWSSNKEQTPSSSSSTSSSSSSSLSPIILPSSLLSSMKSIGDRLYENTYYHSKKCSYVFPGAQVFWNSDSENDDGIDDDDDDDNDNNDDDDDDENEDNDNDDEKEDEDDDSNDNVNEDSCDERRIRNYSENEDNDINDNGIVKNENNGNDDESNTCSNLSDGTEILKNCHINSKNQSDVSNNDDDDDNNDDAPPNKRRKE